MKPALFIRTSTWFRFLTVKKQGKEKKYYYQAIIIKLLLLHSHIVVEFTSFFQVNRAFDSLLSMLSMLSMG
jgi:hypothetical protein